MKVAKNAIVTLAVVLGCRATAASIVEEECRDQGCSISHNSTLPMLSVDGTLTSPNEIFALGESSVKHHMFASPIDMISSFTVS